MKEAQTLEKRFAQRKTQYLCERFEKSPNITKERSITDYLSICYSDQDASIIPTLCDLFFQMYMFVKKWFDYQGDITIQLWIAPTVEDLQFMTCMPCSEGYACAPGKIYGAHIILIDSPLLGGKNSNEKRLSAVLAHEICHHFVTKISRSTLFTMKRKENLDVPMWLEEGLGIVIMTEVNPGLQKIFEERIAQTTKWYFLDEIRNDLSDCKDSNRAYLQAYNETKKLIKHRGKSDLIHLLYLNRIYHINWNDLPFGGKLSANARYGNTIDS
ncbi:MAG: hypothetical protein PVI90_04515 [Desulfobacteraceae bacterium]|jgi:hypothetical protein